MFLYTTMTNSSSTVTTEDGGRQNMFGSEPRIEVMDVDQSKQAELDKFLEFDFFPRSGGGIGMQRLMTALS